MEASAPAIPAMSSGVRFDKPSYKPGVLSYGCDHIRRSIVDPKSGPQSRFIQNYRSALHTICEHSPVLSQHYQNDKGETIARMGPLYLCLQCTTTLPKEQIDKHVETTLHRIFVETRRGHIYCDMCKDFVFDPTLEAYRTKKLETGSSGNPRKRKPDEHAELFQENTIKEASKRSCATTSIRGMWNMGSSCYMSVILESLVHNPLIRNFYLSDGHKPATCAKSLNGEPCLSCNMDDMFQQFNNTESTTAFSAVNVLGSMLASAKSGYYGGLVPNQQQDTHEFLNYILSELCEISSSDPRSLQAEISPAKRRKADGDKVDGNECNCVIHQTFYGKTIATLRCKKCGRVGHTNPQEFAELQLGLDFPSVNPITNKPHTLDYCLKKEYFTEEEFEYRCDDCGQREATSKVSIKTLPNVLCIQLKRFTQQQKTALKIKKQVAFPLKLEMLPYTDKTNEAKGYGKIQHSLKSRSTYQLQSVVTHKGDAIDLGHYVSYSKHEGQWFLFDDHKAYLASKSDVLNAEPYLLFYVIQSLATTVSEK